MTLTDITNMTYDLTKDIDSKHFTSKAQLKSFLDSVLPEFTCHYICQMDLPDGRWWAQFARSGEYYDLYIPDTREEEYSFIKKARF